MQLNKLSTVLLVIVIIWLVSFGISKILESSSVSENKILVVPIRGIIVPDGSYSFIISEESTSSSSLLEKLSSAEKDPSIKAIILEINSPGGTVVASKEVADKVKTLNKPVISWIREYGTSGAYWIASSSDYIIADELSATGSIGVIGSYLEFSRLFEKYGIGYERLTAGDYKDAGTPYRKLTRDEQDLLQKKLDIIHARFKQDIASSRNISSEKINTISSGIFYLGSEAYNLGLIDKLGSKEDAIIKAKELAKIKEAKLIAQKEKKSIIDVISKLLSNSFYYVGKGIGSVLVQDSFAIKAY